MKQGALFFLLIISLFSCTIEKRRYFKGYHVESGKMREWGNGRMTHSTSSGTAPRYISPEARHSGTTPSTSLGSPVVVQIEEQEEPQTTKQQTTEIGNASTAIEVQKPQSRDTPEVGDDVQDDNEIKTERTLPQVSITETESGVSRGGDVGDVATVIFGLLALVAYGLSVLFLGAAVFAIDDLVLTVLLMIGGGFALVGLVFTIIWALLRRKYAAQGQISGFVGDPSPDVNKPRGPWGLIIPCLIFSGFTVLFLLQLGSSTLELSTFIGLLFLAGTASILAVLFGVLAIIRLVQLHDYKKVKEATPPVQYTE